MQMRFPGMFSRNGLFRRFRRDDRGLAIVEFAFVLPIMVLLYVGSVAVTMGVMIDRKVTLMARSLGDIVAQDNNFTTAERDDLWAAGRAIMAPYNASTAVLRMRVSSVRIKTDGSACVDWTQNNVAGYSRTPGQNVTAVIPSDLRVPGSFLIMPEVQYDYHPVIGGDIVGDPKRLNDILFMRPRQTTNVTWNGAAVNPTCAG